MLVLVLLSSLSLSSLVVWLIASDSIYADTAAMVNGPTNGSGQRYTRRRSVIVEVETTDTKSPKATDAHILVHCMQQHQQQDLQGLDEHATQRNGVVCTEKNGELDFSIKIN